MPWRGARAWCPRPRTASRGAPLARLRGDPEQEVREPEPGAVEEARLVDDVVTAEDRLAGGVGRRAIALALAARPLVPGQLELLDMAAVRDERREVALLVLVAALPGSIELRVDPVRPLDVSGERTELEIRQVRALQEPDQVRRRVDRLAVDELHPREW